MTNACVIGGGLAGIAAAMRLADAGVEVTLVESRARLGGLTNSFRRHGLWVDNGQHVFLGCCTSYRGLLVRLGVQDQVQLQSRLDVRIRSGRTGRETRLRRDPLPAPAHLARALLQHNWIPVTERIHTARVALALGRLDPTAPDVDDTAFGDWLRGRGCSAREIETLWDLIGTATLNAHADQSSLALAATVFQLGLLMQPDGADIGWPRIPLQQLHGDAAQRVLENAGTQIRTHARVRSMTQHGSHWLVCSAVGTDAFDEVVLAVPPDIASRLVGAAAMGVPVHFAERLGASPIVNCHIVFNRPVMTLPFLAAVDSDVQWIFDRTAQSGLQTGQYLAVSLSAADEFVHSTVAELRTRLLPQIERLLPQAASAQVLDFFVSREPRATFVPAPGTARYRPKPRTSLPGLSVAGAWTDTGWPATMEGAVRSGIAAADVLLAPHSTVHQEVAA